MNTTRLVVPDPSLPLTVARQLDDACARFEAAWQTDTRPDVAAFLTDVPEEARTPLLLELIKLDVHYRRRAGDTPTAEEYQQRFPALPTDQVAAAAETISDGATTTPPAGREWVAGGHEIMGELGRGGMGVVYKARHLGLNRLVALKMIRSAEFASPAEVSRFRVEAEAVARLQHPNIVPVYEVGECAPPGGSGRVPYLSLEFVSGGTLAARFDRTPQPARTAAEVVEAIARGVQHAHENGIVHRDLKPANVLLTAAGTPKVTDFGLAKLLDADDHTHTGAVLGTPAYMAPEQADGRTREIGPATDVYALGGLLYEALTGGPPFRGENAASTLEMVRTQPPVPPTRLLPTIPRDLEVIALKCLEKEASKRYPTAAALADDLRRYLDGRPILARPTPAWERGLKFVHRRPWQSGLVATAVVSLFAVIGILSVKNAEVQHALTGERQARSELDETNGELAGANKTLAENVVELEAAKGKADRQSDRSRRMLFTAQVSRAAALIDQDPLRALDMLEDAVRCPPELRDFTWGYLRRQSDRRYATISDPNSPLGNGLSFSPDGKSLLIASRGGTPLLIWDVEKKSLRASKVPYTLLTLAVTADHKQLAFPTKDGVTLWDLEGDRARRLIPIPNPRGGFRRVVMSADGLRIAIAADTGPIEVWDVPSRTRVREFTVPAASKTTAFLFTPDGKRLAIASSSTDDNAPGTDLTVWDMTTGKAAYSHREPRGSYAAITFSADGKRMAAGYGWYDSDVENEVRVWEAESDKLVARFGGLPKFVSAVALSADGRTLASGSLGEIRLWDVTGGRLRTTLRGHPKAYFTALAFDPTASLLASGSNSTHSREVVVWSVNPPPAAESLGEPTGEIFSLSASADGRTLITATWSEVSTRVWDAVTGRPRDVSIPMRYRTLTGQSPDGAVAFFAGSRINPNGKGFAPGHLHLWEPSAGAEVRSVLGLDGQVDKLAVSNDGKTVAVWAEVYDETKSRDARNITHEFRLYDVAGQRWTIHDRVTGGIFGRPTFTADGKQVLYRLGKAIVVRDIATGKRRAEFPEDNPDGLIASPDGKHFACGSGLAVVVRELTGGRVVVRLLGHAQQVRALAYTDDGATLASAGEDGLIKLWDTATWEERLTLNPKAGRINCLAFTAHGRTLVSAGQDGRIRLWRAGTVPTPAEGKTPDG